MFLVTLQSLHFSEIMATGSLHVLQCSFALPALGIKNDHDSKTFSPKRLMMSDLILDGRFLHPSYLQLIVYQFVLIKTVEK